MEKMRFKILIFSALRSLNRNKKRSFLTMLGIIIGIASVISIVALGEAYKHKTIKEFTGQEEGQVVLVAIFKPEANNNEPNSGANNKSFFNNEQKHALEKLAFVKSVEYEYNSGYFSDSLQCDIRGTLISGAAKKITDDVVDEDVIGRNLTKNDNSSKRRVVVIPEELIKENIKKTEDLVGSVAIINGISFEVVGIKKSSEEASFFEGPQIQIPEETYNKYFGTKKVVQGFKITLDENSDVKESTKKIEDTLNSMKETTINGKYIVEDTKGAVKMLGGVLNGVTMFIASVAGIALLIAGIGLMNMIYTSISERTREIGIKRALGARKRDIRREFLIEGITLTMIGGIIGYIVGIIIANIISIFLDMVIIPSFFTAILAIVICIVIGLVSSFIPARKAANSNTVDILK